MIDLVCSNLLLPKLKKELEWFDLCFLKHESWLLSYMFLLIREEMKIAYVILIQKMNKFSCCSTFSNINQPKKNAIIYFFL